MAAYRGRSTWSLEVAMYCRDPVLLARPTRRVKLCRRLTISLPLVAVVLFLFVAVAPSVTSVDPLGEYAIVLAFLCVGAFIVVGNAFKIGAIRCPCCGGQFSARSKFFPAAECDNCGYNVETGHKNGDF
jgi:hypothetical protein